MTNHDRDWAVLAAVAQLGPEAYGVTIRQRVGEMLGRVPSVGTVHHALTRLEAAGLVEGRTGEPTPRRGGRAKRLFRMTAAGARALDRARAEARARARALDPDWEPA
jgi:DNA-binding PadR family transcriptional regulator